MTVPAARAICRSEAELESLTEEDYTGVARSGVYVLLAFTFTPVDASASAS